MGLAGRRRWRVVIGFLAIVAVISVVVALLSRMTRNGVREVTWSKSQSQDKSPTVSPATFSTPDESVTAPRPVPSGSEASPPSQVPAGAGPRDSIIPVPGVRPDQLRDTFSESRSEGRVHDAIDIAAPLDTPVLAAADGKILKLFQSEKGGTTIYQLSTDNQFVYYYAHLHRYADGLTEGHLAKQGETIAYVGDTGNAGAGNYHLHFSVALISDPKHYWQGQNINPYPLLRR
jgi:peptidoglycan LD-endopeptidase LytH